MGIFHSKVSSRCCINLKFEAKCRYSGRMWAGEGRRGHGVPMQGTAGEDGRLGRRGGKNAPAPDHWIYVPRSTCGESGIAALMASDALSAAACNDFVDRWA